MKKAAVGIAIAALAALHQGVQESAPLNDDFLHLALSRQLLAGDLPARDFVDEGPLASALSAAAQVLVGHRLLAEAIVVGFAFFVSALLVFTLVRRLTGSTLAAAGAAVLVLLAGPRGYSYPKILAYAVAASIWWAYVLKPSRLTAVALGVWVAIAFYLRIDHGIYVAAGVVLAMVGAHGFRLAAITRTAVSGATALALVLPYIVFLANTHNLVDHVRDVFAQGQTHIAVMDSHAWPDWPLRRPADVVHLAAANVFAPVVSLRWADGATPEARRAVLARHQLTAVAADRDQTTDVRLARTDPHAVVALINEPAVADTAGIDRASASVSSWTPPWNRWRFNHGWLRLRILSGLDDLHGASHAAVTLFYLLPVAAFAILAALRRRLAVPVSIAALAAFSGFVMIVALGILRTPYEVRAADGVVLPAILLGCLLGVGISFAAAGGVPRRVAVAGAVAMLFLFPMKAIAVSGHFGHRVGWFAGDWRSMTRVRAAWSETAQRLVASPPHAFWKDESAPLTVQLAQYATACVPSTERLAVLWFAPEIYYYSDRTMALRHVIFVPGLVSPYEQRMNAAKFTRFTPPIVFAPATFSTLTRALFPELVADVERDYVEAGSLGDVERYVVLVRRGRPAAGTWGPYQWPCFR